MSDMTEFQQRAAAIAVNKMLRAKHFSICDLDAIAKTMGREQQLSGRDYAALRSLHCMDWADMGADLARMTRDKCLEILGMESCTVEMVAPVEPVDEHHEPKHRPRLAFWKKG